MVRGAPASALRGMVSDYHGWREETSGPLRRREGPGTHVVLVISFGHEWLIDDQRLTSFVAGLHDRQVTTEHGGRSFGMQIDLAPQAAHMLFGVPMHTLAGTKVPLEDVLDDPFLVERLYDAERLDSPLRAPRRDVGRAPGRRSSTGTRRHMGLAPIRSRRVDGLRSATWPASSAGVASGSSHGSKRRSGVSPKAAARILRFERARRSAERSPGARLGADRASSAATTTNLT